MFHYTKQLSPLNPNKYDDFHIHMDYVILYGSTEGKCMVWYGMVWYGMIWYDMIWYDKTGGVAQVYKTLVIEVKSVDSN